MVTMAQITPEKVLAALSRHIGKHRGVRADQLVNEVVDWRIPSAACQRQLRNVITELRRQGHHICGHPSTGYYMAKDDDELTATCEFLLQRALTSLEQISAMKKIALPDLRGQLKLPT